MLRAFGVAFVLLAAAASGFVGYRYWSTTAAAGAATATTMRPDFALPDLQGTLQPISQWDGKVLIVNFWATWCEPCRREIPLLQALQNEYAGRGVQVVGVAIDNLEDVKRFVSKSIAIEYPVLVGEQEAVDALAGFGAEMTVLPYTAFVRRDGKVASLHAGELNREQATALLSTLL